VGSHNSSESPHFALQMGLGETRAAYLGRESGNTSALGGLIRCPRWTIEGHNRTAADKSRAEYKRDDLGPPERSRNRQVPRTARTFRGHAPDRVPTREGADEQCHATQGPKDYGHGWYDVESGRKGDKCDPCRTGGNCQGQQRRRCRRPKFDRLEAIALSTARRCGGWRWTFLLSLVGCFLIRCHVRHFGARPLPPCIGAPIDVALARCSCVEEEARLAPMAAAPAAERTSRVDRRVLALRQAAEIASSSTVPSSSAETSQDAAGTGCDGSGPSAAQTRGVVPPAGERPSSLPRCAGGAAVVSGGRVVSVGASGLAEVCRRPPVPSASSAAPASADAGSERRWGRSEALGGG
jgi:hypothetical protein